MVAGAFATVTETTSCLGERVLVDAEGNRVIAASRRPDGSLRKEIRIRPGYVHKDEQERFVTKGKLFRQRVEDAVKEQATYLSTNTTTKKKKKKKQDKINVIADVPPLEVEVFAPPKPQDEVCEVKKMVDLPEKVSMFELKDVSTLSKETLKKRIQQTKTKLRQIAEIEKKIATGSVKVTEEQRKRVTNKDSLLKHLDDLEKAWIITQKPNEESQEC